MPRNLDTDRIRLDDAARAGWLYYIAGNTQDQIARKLRVSRQTAQRLVTLAVSEGLIKTRLDHPIACCMELAQGLIARFGLRMAEVVPTDPESTSDVLGIAQAAAAALEQQLDQDEPLLIGIGTGRTMRAMAEEVRPLDCSHHSVVSLVGNIAPDGTATIFDAARVISEKIRAHYYPLPLPIAASRPAERGEILRQAATRKIFDLAERANVVFIGIGTVTEDAALIRDGVIGLDELHALVKAGAIGEIKGWVFDRDGRPIKGITNDRILATPLKPAGDRLVIGVSMSQRRAPSILGALRGGLVNGLVTNETTAVMLLQGAGKTG